MDYSQLEKIHPDIAKHLFDLGWDYYAAKQGLPDDSASYPSFIEGYNTARSRITGHRPNRYHLKWLQIRYGALKRNRLFDETVTPDVIEGLDGGICLITLKPLTHSTGTDMDWSIDRVSNEIGYTLGNLVIVSTKANQAKGSMSFDEICDAAAADEPTNGLTPFEWQRWRFITSLNASIYTKNGMEHSYYCAPYVTECPPLMMLNPSAVLQIAISKKAIGYRDCHIYGELIDGLPKPYRKALNGILNDAVKLKDRVVQSECEIWFNGSLFRKFAELYDSIPESVILELN